MNADNNIYIDNTDIIFEIDDTNKTEIVAETLLNTDYEKLINLPSINGKILKGDLASDVLELVNKMELNTKEDILNKTDELSINSTKEQYPNAKVVYDKFANKLDVDLENLGLNGEKIICDKSFFPTNVLSAKQPIALDNSQLFRDISLFNRSTFDLSKFAVIGTPIISDDGVASGFGSTNYVKVPIALTSPFTLNYRFNSGNSNEVTVAKWALSFVGEHCTIYCNANSSTVTVEYDANDGTHKFNAFGQLNPNTDYEWAFTVNGSKTTMVIKNLSLGTESTYTLPLFKEDFSATEVALRNFISGSVDLKQFSITVDSKEVFNGNKIGLDIVKPDNYTVVGSPTITSDGVASGFSSSNYLTYSALTSLTTTFTVKGSFETSSTTTGGTIWATGGDSYPNSTRIFISNNILKFAVDYNGTTAVVSSPALIASTKYDFIATQSIDGVLLLKWRIVGSNTWNEATENGILINCTSVTRQRIGQPIHNTIEPFTGSIDLNSFKIYVDGNLVYQPCLKIPYNVSKTGSKIVPAYARDRVIDLYEQEGHAGYYTIDEENKNFTLPMGEIYGLIGQRSLKSSMVTENFRVDIYSDKTCLICGNVATAGTVNLPIELANNNYFVTLSASTKTATSFTTTTTGDYILIGKVV